MSLFASIAPKRVTNVALALMLVLSTVAASVPFIFSEKASAAPNTTYQATGFGGLTWGADRKLPTGGYTQAGDSLTLNVNSSTVPSSGFYSFEGLKAALPTGTTSVQADLYVDPAWESLAEPVIVGMWGQLTDPASTASAGDDAWPTLEFANDSGSPIVEVWDTFGGGVLEALTGVEYGDTVKLEIAINHITDRVSYYLNDAEIYSSDSYDYEPLTHVIFNNYNSGEAGNNYTTTWSNLKTGKLNTEKPVNLRFTKDSTSAILLSGSTVKTTDITLSWDTVTNAERYQVRVTDPTGVSQANRYTGWYTFDLDDATRHGHFGTQQGTWRYEVRTKDATTGEWSAYTTALTLTFDSQKPTGTVTSSSPVMNNDGEITVNATDNLGIKKMSFVTDGEGSGQPYKVWNINQAGDGTTPISISRTVGIDELTAGSWSDGVHTIKTSIEDLAGNIKVLPLFTFTVDNVAPVVSLTTPVDLSTVGNDALVSVTGATGDAVSYELFIDGISVEIGTTFDGYDWNTSGLASGNYTIKLVAKDAANNEGSKEVTVTVDNTSPALAVNSGTTSGNTANITGTAEVGAALSVTFNGTTSSVANINGTWTFAAANLPNGTYPFSITATDAAGNSTQATTSVTVAVAPAGGQQTTIAPPIIGPAAIAETQGVQGVTDDNTGVEGISNFAAVDTDATDGSIFGLAWYWWLLILAALTAIISWIVAAIRRRNNSEA
ncbi:MAG: Ig-like domain-containing protein [Candidatus Microsaccharimonas sp.]